MADDAPQVECTLRWAMGHLANKHKVLKLIAKVIVLYLAQKIQEIGSF